MLTRKCARCGETIELHLPYSKSYVYYKTKGKWYHLDCFVDSTSSRVNIKEWVDKTEAFVLSEVSKDKICQLFFHHYDVSSIPVYIFKKLNEIYNGTYKGLAQPIPPHELYDILIRKIDYLDRNAVQKNLDGVSRINYDLAVAMGSYKSYKEWLTKVKAEQVTTQEAKRNAAYSELSKPRGYVQPDEPREELIDYEETID